MPWASSTDESPQFGLSVPVSTLLHEQRATHRDSESVNVKAPGGRHAVFRIVAFWCAVSAVFYCAWAWIENTWAASFGAQYRSTYLQRAELFRWLICLSLLVLLILAWKWIRPGLN
jgi:hypothetical protein